MDDKHPAMLSVLVPVYCEEESLRDMYRRLELVMGGQEPTLDHEIIFVDDGSTDSTFSMLTGIAVSNPDVNVIRFSRDFGRPVALTAGLEHARGDGVVNTDADLQYRRARPSRLARFAVTRRDVVSDCAARLTGLARRVV